MYIVRRSLLILILVVLVSACGGQSTAEPTMDVDALLTQAVGTFAASMNQTQTAMVTPATETPTPTVTVTVTPFSFDTPIAQPTVTQFVPVQVFPTLVLPTVTGTQYTPTVNPSTLGSGCNNLLLIQDMTIPDGTVMLPGMDFTKTWKVANTGTCDWVYQYQLVLVSGDAMGGKPGKLNTVVAAGKWTQFSIGMTAPPRAGTFTGVWRLGTQNGTTFGSNLTVSIKVAFPTDVPPTNTPPVYP